MSGNGKLSKTEAGRLGGKKRIEKSQEEAGNGITEAPQKTSKATKPQFAPTQSTIDFDTNEAQQEQ